MCDCQIYSDISRNRKMGPVDYEHVTYQAGLEWVYLCGMVQ